MKLIINADDFGYSRGINYGIIDAFNIGVLTSTTLMVNMPGTKHAIELKNQYSDLGVGLHINLTLGNPLTHGKTLVSKKNVMMKPDLIPTDHLYDLSEVKKEIKAQYDLFLKLTNSRPTHLDSHLFSSDKVEIIKQAAIEFANEVDLPLRNHNISNFQEVKFVQHRTFDSTPDLDYVIKYFDEIKKHDIAEIMCHPGYVDQYLLDNSSYNVERVKELEFLTSTKTKDFFEEEDVEFITYSHV